MGTPAIAVGLVLFCLVSVYGRINLEFGSKMFSRIPPSEIRMNWEHIIRYTVTPLILTLGYLYLLLTN